MGASAAGRLLQIGEVAERVGLSLRTVRYYEEMGLVEPESRTEGGFRLYTERQVDRLGFIKQMKPLGFSVQEMRELLDARDAGDRDALAQFAQDAEQRAARLREQAAAGETLVGRLREEAGR